MRREASIPLFLWVAMAVLAHLFWSGGAEQGARLIDERLDVSRFAAGIRNHVRSSIAPPVEIVIDDDSPPEEAIPEQEPLEPTKDDATSEDANAEEAREDPKKQPKKEPKPPEPKSEPEAKPPEPQPPEPKPVTPAEEEAKPVAQLQLPNKIAVTQHDANQKDNPDAAYIADKANKVEEETRARITSTDQNERKPSPGAAPSGPKENPGNAEETHVRQDMDQAGAADRAPGGAQDEKAARATAAAPVPDPGKTNSAAPGKAGAPVVAPPSPGNPENVEKNQQAKAATPERLGAPETLASEAEGFALRRPESPTPEQRAQKPMKRLPPRRPRSLMEALGLGAAGVTSSGVALNLTPSQANEAIGSNEMSRLRRADGERRRSEHRGSWRTPSFERYRSAIENYVPSVKPGNQTALNTAAVPFASYLNQIHNRIHPLFADQFLSSLDAMPASHPMNDQSLVTALEIVVEREEGRLVRRGVTRTSGVTAFDISAIAAVERAAPFGTPPDAIVSPDGNVYLHWEFRRDGMACSTLYAHPFILKGQPKPAPLPTDPPLPPFRGPDGEPSPPAGERHGRLQPLAPEPTAPEG